jgi:NDP-sugar pyrophosphorylase family protein
MQLVIPMSGLGSRFVEAGYVLPKPCIEVDGFPMISRLMTMFPGISDVHFICNSKHLRETRIGEILENVAPGAVIHEVPACRKLGPVDAVVQIGEYINQFEPVIVSYCDFGGLWDFHSFKEFVAAESSDGCVVCYTGFHPHMLVNDQYAYCLVEGNRVIKVKEKSSFTDHRMSEFASNGIYYFRNGAILKKYFEKLMEEGPSLNGEFYCSLVFQHMVDDGLKVNTFLVDYMLQWGTPKDLSIYQYWSDYFSEFVKNGLPSGIPHNALLLLPMAGYGSRFSQEGYCSPKPMLDINDGPMFAQAVRCLPPTNEIAFVCLEEHLRSFDLESIVVDWFENARIISICKPTDGQASTCALALAQLQKSEDRPLYISACDNGVHYDELIHQGLIDDPSVDVVVWSFRNNPTVLANPDMYSWLDVDSRGNVKNVSCKKFPFDDPMACHAIVGTMFFRKSSYFLDAYAENRAKSIVTNGEYYVDDVINRCIERGLVVKVFEVRHYICWGTPNDYKTYKYWQSFFEKCEWHDYSMNNDPLSHKTQ